MAFNWQDALLLDEQLTDEERMLPALALAAAALLVVVVRRERRRPDGVARRVRCGRIFFVDGDTVSVGFTERDLGIYAAKDLKREAVSVVTVAEAFNQFERLGLGILASSARAVSVGALSPRRSISASTAARMWSCLSSSIVFLSLPPPVPRESDGGGGFTSRIVFPSTQAT